MFLRTITFSLGLAVWLATGCASSADSDTQRSAEKRAIELGEVDTLIHKARAEVTTGQYPQARQTIEDVIRRLSARPKTEDDKHWVQLMTAAADTARDSYHTPAERGAREHIYAWLQAHVPADHPDLLAARMELARTLEVLGDSEGAPALRQKARG